MDILLLTEHKQWSRQGDLSTRLRSSSRFGSNTSDGGQRSDHVVSEGGRNANLIVSEKAYSYRLYFLLGALAKTISCKSYYKRRFTGYQSNVRQERKPPQSVEFNYPWRTICLVLMNLNLSDGAP
jgi:hypothetical protein